MNEMVNEGKVDWQYAKGITNILKYATLNSTNVKNVTLNIPARITNILSPTF